MIYDYIKTSLKLVKNYRYQTLTIFVCGVLAASFEALSISATLPIIELTVAGGFKSSDSELAQIVLTFLNFFNLPQTITSVSLLLFIAISIKALVSFGSMNIIGWVIADITNNLRKDYITGLLNANWNYLKTIPTGKSLNTINYEIPKAASIFRYLCLLMIKIIEISILVYLCYLISPVAAVAGMIMGFILFILLSVYVRISREQSNKQIIIMNSFLSNLYELIKGLKVIKSMNIQSSIKDLLFKESNIINATTKKQVTAKHGSGYFQEPITMFFICAGLIFLSTNDELMTTSILILLIVFFRISQTLGKLQSDYQTFATNYPYLTSLNEKVNSLLNEVEANVIHNIDLNHGLPENDSNLLEIRNLSFNYPDKKILKDLSLTFPIKGLYSIVGPSGQGKTTLLDILLGLIKVNDDSVFINGMDINKININQYRSSIGYVSQESMIFNDTLKMNICIGLEETLDEDNLKTAISLSGVEEFISGLENSIDTILLEGGNLLSGGQKQRVTLARALFRKPKILILDEFTSALDHQTKIMLLKNIKNISQEILVVCVTHDQSLMSMSDIVYELKDGSLKKILYPERK